MVAEPCHYSRHEWIFRAVIEGLADEHYPAPALQRIHYHIPLKVREEINRQYRLLRKTVALGRKPQSDAAKFLLNAIEGGFAGLASCTDATLGTPLQVCNQRIREDVQPTLIVVDGAGEIAAAESQAPRTFTSAKCTIIAGDLYQARPRPLAHSDWNELALQARLPWLARLVLTYFPTHALRTMHRSNKPLVTFVGKLAYKKPELIAQHAVEFEPIFGKAWPTLKSALSRDEVAVLLVDVERATCPLAGSWTNHSYAGYAAPFRVSTRRAMATKTLESLHRIPQRCRMRLLW
jgi:hypothetical protein